MIKKDYEMIAKKLYEVKAEHGDNEILQEIVVKLSSVFSEDNPKFNNEKFWDACGYEEAK